MITCSDCKRRNLDNAEICEKCGAFLKVKKTKLPADAPVISVTGIHKVVITDIRMPFWSMIKFMVKWIIASVTAVIIVVLFILIFISIASGLGSFVKIFSDSVSRFF